MIMGDTCTRACAFCDVKTGKPEKLDPYEDIKIANAVKKLNLRHVVITSVDRDDLPDGGSNHFRKVVDTTRKKNPNTTIEVLTPDFLRKGDSYKKLLEADLDVFNHNIETVPRLYLKVRPGARYFASLELLKNVKKDNKKIFTKSGIMVGLGEEHDEIVQVMDDLRSANVDFITIGQYLQPSVKHHPLERYYHPDEFKELELIAKSKGFLLVSSSPLTRSSYHADEDFNKLKKLNLKKNIYVEAESSKIGNVHIPKSIWAKMIISPRVEIEADLKLRANFLVKDYDYMCDNPDLIYPLLSGLRKRLSKKLIDSWEDLILKKNWEELTKSFLQNHYDPSYSSNTIKNDRKIIKLINAKSLSHSEISKIAKKILKNN